MSAGLLNGRASLRGNVDMENCKTRMRLVDTKEEAERLAREVWPLAKNVLGGVHFYRARYHADEDGGQPGYWEGTQDDSESYQGDE